MTRRAGVEEWIKTNGWAILAAAFALYGGYVTGQTTTNARLTRLEEIVNSNATRLDKRRDFMVCTVRQMDQIQDELGIEPPCDLQVQD